MERKFVVEENTSYDISYGQSEIDAKHAALKEEDPRPRYSPPSESCSSTISSTGGNMPKFTNPKSQS